MATNNKRKTTSSSSRGRKKPAKKQAAPIRREVGACVCLVLALLTVLCCEAQKEAVVQAIFKHTATIGIRETLCRRYVLTRTEETVEPALGPVRRKVSSGYGVQRAKFEHDDLAVLAEKNGLSLTEVMEKIDR